MLKRIVSIFLLAVMLMSVCAASAIAEDEQTALYSSAAETLKAYLVSKGAKGSLDDVIAAFEALGDFGYSKQMLYYTSALKMIMEDDFSFKLDFYLERTESNAPFNEYLEAEQVPLCIAPVLRLYANGRQAENEGNVQAAIDAYGQCGGFFDSADRLKALKDAAYGVVYDDAEALLAGGDLEGAYALLITCPGYKDADDYVQYIINKLGYDPAHEHVWDAGEGMSATCAAEGEMIFTCLTCGAVKTEAIPKSTEHTGETEIRNAKDATCGAAGYSGDIYCKDCGQLIGSGRETSATGDHTWDDGKVTNEATCAAEGEMTFACLTCGAVKTEAIPKSTKHTGETEVRNTKEATCGAAGYSGDIYCVTCGQLIGNGRETPAAGDHTWDDGKVTLDATCATEGEMTFACLTCGAVKTEAIPKSTEHTGETEIRNAKKATCGEAGYSGDIYCMACGQLIESGREMPAAGDHTWDDGKVTVDATCAREGVRIYTCKICEATRIDVIPKNSDHTGGTETRNKKDATCGAAGYTGDTYCKTCGRLISSGRSVSATGSHSWDSGRVTTEATCAGEGFKTYTCKVCGATKTETIQKNTNHTGGTEVRNKKDATCGSNGYTGDTYCKTCGRLISSGRSVSATGSHSWDSGKVTKQPTSTDTGVRTYTCKVCGSTKTETIAATGPNVNKGDYVRFGRYPQTRGGGDSTAIEWLVLAVEGNYGLVVSRYGLDNKQFHTSSGRITWERCSLRSWLNNDFYKSAFTSSERNAIQNVTVYNNRNHGFTDDNSTNDNIFILSEGEMLYYFGSDSARMCVATDYAKSKGVYTSSDYSLNGRQTCRYWDRSPYEKNVCYVSRDGTMNWVSSATYTGIAVRPAMWVDLTKVN